jgi:hypothetical protein
MIQQIHQKNPILFWLGLGHLIVFFLLVFYLPFNDTIVLGINSLYKPMKFALSIWIYSWTMALILSYFTEQRKIKTYSWVAVMAMSFEQIAITFQALRGELSHFNRTDTFGMILYSLMGIFILTITLWTAYLTFVFITQKQYNIPATMVLGIKIGLVYFVIFSLFGGYISSLQGHTVGAKDGGEGLLFLNWSTISGDLRVAHFFGIHALQVIPLFSLFAIKIYKINYSKISVWLFSVMYLAFIIFTLIQGLNGISFVGK